MPATFTEVLPAQKSSRHNAMNWTPGSRPGTGLLTIHTARATAKYAVTEFPTPWDGRAFHLVKLTPGTDREAESYDVFCGRGKNHRCECRGFLRHSHCKHIDAALAIWDNGWLDMANGEQDVSSTEAPF
jgi:hypothetical protein